jgi:hypothetical protein
VPSSSGWSPTPQAEWLGLSSTPFRPVPIRWPVIEFDEREYRAFLEHEVQRGSGLSVEEFVRRYEAGELDEGDPDVSDLAGLLWLGQNGHRAAA